MKTQGGKKKNKARGGSRPPRFGAIRNILIVLAAAVAVVAATEISLGLSKGKSDPETYAAEKAENELIQQLQFGWMEYEDYFAATLFGENFDQLPVPDGHEKTDIYTYNGYPLIRHLQSDDDYDGDTVDIVVLGDSFTFGQSSLDRNEVFWRLAENELRNEGYNVRFYAAAEIAANSKDELRWLTNSSLVGDIDPDLVIFAYLYNDPDDSVTAADMMSDFTSVDGSKHPVARAISKILPNIGKAVGDYITVKTLYTAEGKYAAQDFFAPIILKGDVRERFERDFIAPLDSFSESSGVPVVIMTLPVYQGKSMQKALYAPLHEICGKYDHVKLYDGVDEFFGGFVSAKHKKNYDVNSVDHHPGSATNYFYSQYIQKFLKEDYADMLGESAGRSLLPEGMPRINESLPAHCVLGQTSASNEINCAVYYPGPDDEGGLPSIALGKSFVILSFAAPVSLQSVSIDLKNADAAELYCRTLNEKLEYDDHTVRPFGEKSGNVWTADGSDKVTALLIHVDGAADDGALLDITIR